MHSLLLLSSALSAIASLQPAMAQNTNELLRNSYAALERFYQDLHSHPELSLEEKRTAGKVREEFQRLGLQTLEIGGGVVGILRNGAGPTTLIRSELDALPVTEDTGLPYKSQVPGVMHACGHDLHTTALLGTAIVMKDEKAKWKGTLVFLAQPGEEKLKGAKTMMDAGLFKKIPKPDQCLAIHTRGSVPSGKVGFTSGHALAAVSSVDVVVRGVGAHGAAPNRGVDPIMLASEFVVKTQTLIGREIDPMEPALITVGSFHGGTKHNIIPAEAKLQLSVRAYKEAVESRLLTRLREIAQGMAKIAGAPAPTVEVTESSPAVFNDPVLVARWRKAVTAALGEKIVIEEPPSLGADDFGLFGKTLRVPSAILWIGAGQGRNFSFSNHSPKFAPDFETVMPIAVKTLVAGLMDLHGSR